MLLLSIIRLQTGKNNSAEYNKNNRTKRIIHLLSALAINKKAVLIIDDDNDEF